MGSVAALLRVAAATLRRSYQKKGANEPIHRPCNA